MPSATELVSVADLKAFLAITSTSMDTKLTALKADIEAMVKTYCGRDLLVPSTDYTEYYDGDGSLQLIVNQRPVISVASIYIDPSCLFESGTLVPNLNSGSPAELISSARKLNSGIIELFSYAFLRGRRSVKITYSAGYATVPSDLQRAVKLIAAKAWKMQDLQMTGQISQQVGDKTVTYEPDSWPKEAAEILHRYRRIEL